MTRAILALLFAAACWGQTAYTNGTYYFPPGGGAAANATESVVATLLQPGTFSSLLITSGVTGAGTATFTFRKAGVSQTLTCAVTQAAPNCTDTTHSFTNAASDLIAIQMVVAGGTMTFPALWTMSWTGPSISGSGGAGITQLTSDITAGPGTGSQAATLATVNGNVGSFGDATHAGQFTANAKGLLTAAASVLITPAVGSITGLASGIATFLATPSSANLLATMTDKTGTGLLVFGTSPTIVTPTIASFTNATHTHTNAAGGGQLNITTAANATGTPSSSTFLRGDNTWSTPSGSGTVTVVGAGSLTSTALVTGGGSQALQTPAATATMDTSGNISTPGTITTGVGSGNAGAFDMGAGTSVAVPATSFGWGAPSTMTTSVRLESPNAVPSANNVMLFGAPSSNKATWAWTGISGTGSFAMTTSPTFVTPVLGAATGTSLLATGIVDGTAPITITTGTTANLGTTYKSGYTLNQEATAGTGVTYTLPATATGLQYCVTNSGTTGVVNIGVITVYPPASSFVINKGVVNTVGGGGTHGVASGGAAGDSACFVAIDSTHWQIFIGSGTWTSN